MEGDCMKKVLITGAAHGLGLALAHSFKDDELILIDKDELALQAVNLDAKKYVCDLANVDEVSMLLEKLNEEISDLDVLINNAGEWISGDLSKMDQEGFSHMNTLENIHHVLNTNVFGSIAMIRGLYQKLENGLIININSQSGVHVETPFPIYNTTKQAMKAFRFAIEDDLQNMKIKVTDIYPGLINTSFYKHAKSFMPDEVLETGLKVESIVDAVHFVVNQKEHVTIPSMEIKSF